MKRLLFVAMSFAVALAASAQMPDTSWKAEMAKLAPMVGEWKGEGWIQMGRAGRSEFRVHETVEEKTGGRALLIQGLGHEKTEDGSEGRVVHDALAVVSWDAESGSYRFDAHTAQAGRTEATMKIGADGKMIWGFETPRGAVRYTIDVSETTWHEVGEFQPMGGEEWMQFMEMKLDRVK